MGRPVFSRRISLSPFDFSNNLAHVDCVRPSDHTKMKFSPNTNKTLNICVNKLTDGIVQGLSCILVPQNC